MTVELAGLEIVGRSIGGLETCLQVPAWDLSFDLGGSTERAWTRSTVLFTHAHVDHLGAVAQHCALRELRRVPAPTYVVPRENAADFSDLMDVWRRLDGSRLAHRLVPLGVGEEHALGRGLVARAFRSPHRAPCQGYVISREIEKLRAEYAHLPGPEIAARRRAGESLTRVTRVPELAFTGDARADVFDREPELYSVRRLIVEATFLDEQVSVERARSMGHVHLDELVERADRFENEAILLTHFSSRYGRREIVALLDRRLPASLRARVTPLLDGFRP